MNRLAPRETSLKQLRDGGSIPLPYLARYPGRMCSFRPISAVLTMIPDSMVVLIGPAICTFNGEVSNSTARFRGSRLTRNWHFVTLDQHDITFGTEEKVRKAILRAAKESEPATIFVVTSCLQELIAEDFDSFIHELDQELSPNIVPIHSDNFRSEDPAVGIGEALATLVPLMRRNHTMPDTFNVLGMRASGLQRSELVQSLEASGLRVNTCILDPRDPHGLANASRGAFNLSLDHHTIPLAEKMQQEFGIPFFHMEKSFDLESIAADYRKLAQFIGSQFDRSYELPEPPEHDLLLRLRARFSGLSAVVTTQHGRTLSLVRLLVGLGMQVPTIFLKQLDCWDRPDLEALIGAGVDARIVRGDDRLAVEAVLAETRPDFAVGFLEPEAQTHLRGAYVPMTAQEALYGYPVVTSILERLDSLAIDTTSLRAEQTVGEVSPCTW